MKIYVKLFANLVRRVSEDVTAKHSKKLSAGTPLEIELPENSSITDLLSYLALRREEVITVFVGGRAREFDYMLTPGDQVGIFPPLGGG